MSPHELIQLATVLQSQAIQVLKEYLADSPQLIGHTIAVLDDLPGLLENSFLEADCLNELSRETERARRAIAQHYGSLS